MSRTGYPAGFAPNTSGAAPSMAVSWEFQGAFLLYTISRIMGSILDEEETFERDMPKAHQFLLRKDHVYEHFRSRPTSRLAPPVFGIEYCMEDSIGDYINKYRKTPGVRRQNGFYRAVDVRVLSPIPASREGTEISSSRSSQ